MIWFNYVYIQVNDCMSIYNGGSLVSHKYLWYFYLLVNFHDHTTQI